MQRPGKNSSGGGKQQEHDRRVVPGPSTTDEAYQDTHAHGEKERSKIANLRTAPDTITQRKTKIGCDTNRIYEPAHTHDNEKHGRKREDNFQDYFHLFVCSAIFHQSQNTVTHASKTTTPRAISRGYLKTSIERLI